MSRLSQLAINDEGFVFDPSTGESYTVNKTGLLILKGLKDNKTTRAIAESLSEKFDVADDEAEDDVQIFVSFLRASAIL